MKIKIVLLMFVMLSLVGTGPLLASASKDHGAHSKKEAGAMNGSFSHETMVDGLKTEFQIMSLESMNMKDPEGATHHVMVKVSNHDSGEKIGRLAGKVKIISPSGKEQVATLKDYSGTYAANFTASEKGKYGVICLFKENDSKHVVKFWYPRH